MVSSLWTGKSQVPTTCNSSLFSENNSGTRKTFCGSASCRVEDYNSVRMIGCLQSCQKFRIFRVKVHGKAVFSEIPAEI